jgi:hydrophobe/amphiphile efflux-3 (HAE3) family protein
MANSLIEPYLITYRDPVLSIADAIEGIIQMQTNGTLGIANAPDDILISATEHALDQNEFSPLVSRGEGTERKFAMVILVVDYQEYNSDLMVNDEKLDLEIEDIFEDTAGSEYKIHVMGGFNNEVQKNTMDDLSILLPLCFLVLIIILWAALRSVGDVLISVIALFSTLVITFGLFALLNLPFNQMTFFAPILIMVLSVDFAIHILMRYKEENDKAPAPGRNMSRAVRFVGISITLSALTTIAAFSSNGFSNIPAVASFGFFISMGIAVAYMVMIFFMPSLKLIIEQWRHKRLNRSRSTEKVSNKIRKSSRQPAGSGMKMICGISYRYPKYVVGAVIIFTLFGLFFTSQLEKDMVMEELLANDSEKLETLGVLEDEFPDKSSSWISVIVKGDVARPEVLIALDQSITNMANDRHVIVYDNIPATNSILSYLKPVMNQAALPAGVTDSNMDQIPDTATGVTAVFNELYSNGIPGAAAPENIREVLSSGRAPGSFDMTLIVVEVEGVEGKVVGELLDEIRDDVEPLESTAGIQVSFVGFQFENFEVINSMTEGMVLSTIVSIILCTVIIIALLRSVGFGLLTALPVSLATIWILASTYLLGFNLNPVTATTTAMTIGIGIDYSIHLTERYRQERAFGLSINKAMKKALDTTGVALLAAGVTTATGFGIISLSRVGMFHEFGLLAFLIVIYVLIAALVVLPSMIVSIDRAKEWYTKKQHLMPRGLEKFRTSHTRLGIRMDTTTKE